MATKTVLLTRLCILALSIIMLAVPVTIHQFWDPFSGTSWSRTSEQGVQYGYYFDDGLCWRWRTREGETDNRRYYDKPITYTLDGSTLSLHNERGESNRQVWYAYRINGDTLTLRGLPAWFYSDSAYYTRTYLRVPNDPQGPYGRNL